MPNQQNQQLADTPKEPMNAIAAALSGGRGHDQQRLAAEGVKWVKMLLDKNQDYGSSVWQAPSLVPGCSSGIGILVRIGDKIARLKQLQANPATCYDESFEDTLRDLGGYCLLYFARPADSAE